jgi:hypothetical protein
MSEDIALFRSQIISSAGGDILKEASELAIDSALKDGLVKDIPIIGGLVSIYKLGKGIREVFEIKKLSTFLLNLQSVTEKDKKEFDNKLSEGTDSRNDFYARLLLLLQNLDEVQKAEIVSNFFKLYIYSVISKSEFFRFTNIVNKGYLEDIMALHYTAQQVKGFGPATEEQMDLRYDDVVQENLLSLGLLRKKTEEELEKEKEHPYHKHTDYFPTTMGTMFSFMMYYKDSYLDNWKKDGHRFYKVSDV